MESKVLDEAIRSVRDPILKFIETGIFCNPYSDPDMPPEVLESVGFISDTQTQRVARMVAKELRRPFIIMTPVIKKFEWSNASGKWVRKRVDPTFSHVYVKIPKRKYLMPIVAPLLLTCSDTGKGLVTQGGEESNWVFNIHSEALWVEYRAALDRPEMRAARRMPPL
jgi:hypothetical protein